MQCTTTEFEEKPFVNSHCNYKSDSTIQGIKVTIAVPAIRSLKSTDSEMGGAPAEKGCERVAEGAEFVPVPETGVRVVVRGRDDLGGTLIAVGSPTSLSEAVCVAQNGSIRAVRGQSVDVVPATGFIP